MCKTMQVIVDRERDEAEVSRSKKIAWNMWKNGEHDLDKIAETTLLSVEQVRDVLTIPTMKSIDSDKKAGKSGAVEEATANDNNGFFKDNAKIDFSNVKVEPLFEEEVDFDTFSKSDFRAVKVKECVAVPKSKKLLQFTLDDGTGTDRTILSGIHSYYEPETPPL